MQVMVVVDSLRRSAGWEIGAIGIHYVRRLVFV